jgi:hypothetical protein
MYKGTVAAQYIEKEPELLAHERQSQADAVYGFLLKAGSFWVGWVAKTHNFISKRICSFKRQQTEEGWFSCAQYSLRFRIQPSSNFPCELTMKTWV